MAASNWFMYGHALENIFKAINVDTDSFRIVLVTDSYTPNQSTDDAWSDISTNEVANGGGYATHGGAINLAVSRSGLAVTFDGEDETWSTATITAKYAVIVRDADANGSLAATDIPIAYAILNTSGNQISTGGDFIVTMNASGIYTATAAAAA